MHPTKKNEYLGENGQGRAHQDRYEQQYFIILHVGSHLRVVAMVLEMEMRLMSDSVCRSSLTMDTPTAMDC